MKETKFFEGGENKISAIFRNARAVAILTVIAAHITVKNLNWLSHLYSVIGSIGVIVFFIISGYYYKKEKFSILCKKKLISVILPWIILGSIVYIVNTLLAGNNITLLEWFKWLIGYKTYLYFIPVLLCCFLIFYYHNLISIIIAMAITAISLVLTVIGVITPILEMGHITNYMNICNWVGFFALGLLLKKIDPMKFYSFIKKTRWIWIISSLCFTILLIILQYKVGYFSALGWLYELIAAFSVFGLCSFEFMNNRLVFSISNFSYPIYILHMLFIGVLAKIYNLHLCLLMISNIIVLFAVWGLLCLGLYIAKKIKLDKIYKICIGIRLKDNEKQKNNLKIL